MKCFDRGVSRPLRVHTTRGSTFFKGAYMRWGRRISSDVAPALKAAMLETGDWNTSHVRISLANCLIYGPPLTVFVRMHCLSTWPVRLRLCNYYYFPILDNFWNCSCVTKGDASSCNHGHKSTKIILLAMFEGWNNAHQYVEVTMNFLSLLKTRA